MPQAHQPTRTSPLPTVETRLTTIKEARKAAQEAQQKVQASWIKENLRYHEYNIRSQVWLKGTNLKLPENMMKKLSPRQYRPFRVAAKNIPSHLLPQPPTPFENTPHFPHIPAHPILRNNPTQTKLPRTTPRHCWRRGRMGGGTNNQNTSLWMKQETSISRQMEGILPHPQSVDQ
jgi:hypothetical protein